MFDFNRYDELMNLVHSCESAIDGEHCPKALAYFNLLLAEAKSELNLINNEHVASDVFVLSVW